MRYHSYLNTAKKIIETYKGATPLPDFLKRFFAADKKYGSKDRRQIAALCYNYYRLGKAFKDVPVEERIIISTFLCEEKSSAFIAALKPGWNEKITSAIADKIAVIFPVTTGNPVSINEVFPWQHELSDQIDTVQFCNSFLQQPDLFLRIRPGKKNIVTEKLNNAAIAFTIQHDCITLPNATKIDSILELNKEAIVQDKNSQKVLDFFKFNTQQNLSQSQRATSNISCWDCCAASGGKSILLYDIFKGNIQLAVSDIRESILFNLKKRFEAAGIKNYRSFVADLVSADLKLPVPSPQIVICDAPCTGSGTWGRTPEQLFYFEEEQIDVYAKRQQQIVANVIPHLQKDGLFVYITCSVFKKENEAIVSFMQNSFQLQLLQVQVLKGYNEKADSMFVAVLRK